MHQVTQTPARTRFKQHLGQANHFLVTTLLGLETLDHSETTEAPPDLRAAWNPKDKSASISRARIFVLQSFLGWAVDSIDMYLSLLNRKPKFVRDDELVSAVDGAGRSVSRKARAVAGHFGVHPATYALVDVLITWRNNVFHELSDTCVQPLTERHLAEYADLIRGKYRGLVVDALASKAGKGDALTFKEAASLINATHAFVEEVDGAVLSRLDLGSFCVEAVTDALGRKDDGGAFSAKYQSLTSEARLRFVRNWLQNVHGMSGLSEDVVNQCASLRPSHAG